MKKLVKTGIISGAFLGILSLVQVASGNVFPATEGVRIEAKISKSGLNRITNPPYQITQVTGDDSRFRLKFDDDGVNIYLMPLVAVGEKIEISLKNSAGNSIDMELLVTNSRGQTINIDNKSRDKTNDNHSKDVARMLKAMQEGKIDKFYVQDTSIVLSKIGQLDVTQTKLYKWRNLVGAIFKVSNNSNQQQNLDLSAFIKRFDNPIASFVSHQVLNKKETASILLIQNSKE